MKILVDTHIALAILSQNTDQLYPDIDQALTNPELEHFFSVVSLWEIAIKTRLGKLGLNLPLKHIVPYFEAIGMTVLSIQTQHVIIETDPVPQTRDPFDRLLLAQCQSENMQLVTIDQALKHHPLAFKP